MPTLDIADLEVLTEAVSGRRAADAWRMLEDSGQHLLRNQPPEREFVQRVVAHRGWLVRSIEPTGDALLHSALAIAARHGWAEQAQLALVLGARTANRGELRAAAGWLRRARTIGPSSGSSKLLAFHVAVRAGEGGSLPELEHVPPRALGLQKALFLIAAGQFGDAEALLRKLRDGAEGAPLICGAASFFLAEACLRQHRWSDVLEHCAAAEGAMAFMGNQPYRWTLGSWRARALRNLRRPGAARRVAVQAYKGGEQHGLSEVMIEASIELAELSEGEQRRRWRGEVASLLPGTVRPEVRRRAAPLLAARSEDAWDGLQVHACGDWICCRGNTESLLRRESLRRILRALASAEGQPLDAGTLFESGWPGETIRHESRVSRVHTAIWQLRRLGLGSQLVHRPAGYVLDPEVRVVF